MVITCLPGRLAVCRLQPAEPIPDRVAQAPFFSVTRAEGELSIVCPEAVAPAAGAVEGGWRAFMVQGPLDFSLTGVLASLASPLAGSGVSLFALSTYQTDYILVKAAQFGRAASALSAAGHQLALQATDFLGCGVRVTVDRPLGSRHPDHGFLYPVNYGYVDGVPSADGEDLDAYLLGIDHAVSSADGECIAVIHRTNDDDDKLVVAPPGMDLPDEAIRSATGFQEQFFTSVIERSGIERSGIERSGIERSGIERSGIER